MRHYSAALLGAVALGFTFLLGTCAPANHNDPVDISSIIRAQDIETQSSALLIVRLSDGQRWESNPVRLQTRFSPASTSKIPHTLIALEERVSTAETHYVWDGQERWAKSWNQDQTLSSAYQRSAVWVYQEITSELGNVIMGDWLAQFEYGNFNVGGPESITQYWLQGPLAISAEEQAQFLTQLSQKTLSLSDHTYDEAQSIMLSEDSSSFRLYSKTGWYFNESAMDIGWYVGWVETSNDAYVFAFNLDMDDQSLVPKRKTVVRAALAHIGAMPP